MPPKAQQLRALPQHRLQKKAPGSIFRVLNKFVFGGSVVPDHPLYEKYGEAYEWFVQGEAYRKQESLEDAVRYYQRAIHQHNTFIEAYLGMGSCFRRRGDLKNALTVYQKALAINQFCVEALIEIAKTYHEAGFLDKAIVHFRRANRIAPKDVEAKFNLALCLELNDEMTAALDVYIDIIETDAGFAPAYNNLGSIYMRMGRYEEAEEAFRELINLSPEFIRAYLGLAICLDKTNRPKEALPYYEKLLLSRYHMRNREFVESRIRTIRRYVGLNQNTTATGTQLVRVK